MGTKIFTDIQTEAFIETLNRKVTGWSSMDQDPAWTAWLAGQHFGKTKLQLLREAYATFDAEAVINLVQDFRASAEIPPMTPARPRQEEGVRRSFIKDFYQAIIRGRYRGREKEQETIQGRIDQAISTGKVLNG